MPTSPATSNIATVYWDTKSKDVYLIVNNLPEPPSDRQYQLWAIVDGQPVDAGVFDVQNVRTFEDEEHATRAGFCGYPGEMWWKSYPHRARCMCWGKHPSKIVFSSFFLSFFLYETSFLRKLTSSISFLLPGLFLLLSSLLAWIGLSGRGFFNHYIILIK